MTGHAPTRLMPHSDRVLPTGQLLLCGALIVTLSMGIRHGFGLWLQPITSAHGWSRETYSIALAIQNLVWGASGPLIGWWADRQGALKVIWTGGLLYALGLVGMALSSSPLVFTLSTGLTIGLAQACSTYSVIYGVLGRHIAPEKRSMAMGITGAAGSFGQFLMVPLASWLIQHLGWSLALLALATSALLMLPVAFGLHDRPQASPPSNGEVNPLNTSQALRHAFSHRGYLLLMAGYFVCGFQLAFIGIHLPSYLRDIQLPPDSATTALALIGLFNVIGTYATGALGQRWRKSWILSAIYALRALAIALFVLVPASPWSVAVFASVMGALWLSTVPPTNAIVAQLMGVRHLSMLGGLVFFSHQIGSFTGVWLGGYLYDLSGSYMPVWWLAAALGVVAALLNLPVREDQAQREPHHLLPQRT
ncbi:MFS transporter [Aquabacterium sp.]|uniref:MFS transporter n=1 Tax=Aquabacterium sp. TaxID=1872578 RepID=UPI002E3009CD|nr:MFS transporter [Aquabacterium sp.]HEX5311647.1 MFS transporter [Aquabacterium sp.]